MVHVAVIRAHQRCLRGQPGVILGPVLIHGRLLRELGILSVRPRHRRVAAHVLVIRQSLLVLFLGRLQQVLIQFDLLYFIYGLVRLLDYAKVTFFVHEGLAALKSLDELVGGVGRLAFYTRDAIVFGWVLREVSLE